MMMMTSIFILPDTPHIQKQQRQNTIKYIIRTETGTSSPHHPLHTTELTLNISSLSMAMPSIIQCPQIITTHPNEH